MLEVIRILIKSLKLMYIKGSHMGLREEVRSYLLSNYREDMKNQLDKLLIDIDQFDFEGDLYKFLRTFFQNNKRKIFNENLGLNGKETLFDIISRYSDQTLEDRTFDDLDKSTEYNSYQISALIDNFNVNIGMYCGRIKGENIIVLKANTAIADNSEDGYTNKWIIDDIKLKYYLMNESKTNFEKRTYSHKVNRLMYETYIMDQDVKIYLFSRNTKRNKYLFKGIFSVLRFAAEGNYVELIKNSSIEVNDILYYQENKQNEEDRIVEFEDENLYNYSQGKIRRFQGLFRKKLLESNERRCMVCGLEFEEILIASHIKPYSLCEDARESCDVDNGLILCPLHDALFDKGFISFNNKGEIIISEKLKESNWEQLNFSKFNKIEMNEKKEKFMSFHRDLFSMNFKEK
ncbi:MAG: HNH endonuclease [Bacilli bacterium]